MPDKIKKLTRARMAKTGESYQTALRHVMAQAPTDRTDPMTTAPTIATTTPAIIAPNQPRFRHVHLGLATEHEIDVFTFNQNVSFFVARFPGWTAERHWLEPVYHRAGWANEDGGEVTEEELRGYAVKALDGIPRRGYALAVHAPGRLALIWSDLDVPRQADQRGMRVPFGPSMKAIGQPVVEGPPPPWWPGMGPGVPSPIVIVSEHERQGYAKRLAVRCTVCGATTAFDAFQNHPSLPIIEWDVLSRWIEARFDGRQHDTRSLPMAKQIEMGAIVDNLVPTWRRELRSPGNGGCTHV